MSERLDPPDPEPVIDRGRLEDEAYERQVQAELWGEVEPMIVPLVTNEQPALVRRDCPWCLQGTVILPYHQLAVCGCCNGRGYFLMESE